MNEDRKYWIVHQKLIPRNDLSLLEFIESQGYETEIEKIGNNESGTVYSKRRKESIMKVVNEKVILMYPPMHIIDKIGLLEEAIDLREILEVNGIEYEEFYNRKHMVPYLKKTLNELLKRLEG